MPHGPHAGIARKATGLAARAVLLAAVVAAVAIPAVAGAASVAYVDNGEVWLSSLDGAKKARLATPVVNADGETEKWLDVAQSDGGRIVAVRNKPGRISNFSWFKIWEPDGTSTVEGPLNAPSGWIVVRLSARLRHHRGRVAPRLRVLELERLLPDHVRARDRTSGRRPTARSIRSTPAARRIPRSSARGSSRSRTPSSPTVVNVQDADAGNPYTNTFTPWLDTSGVGLDLDGVDVAANGRLAALGFEAWDGGTQTVGKIAVLAIQGVDQPPAFPAAVDCFVPAAGIARDASLAQDAGAIAWKDDGGVKVAGSPSTAADPCVMGSAPVVLSPTGDAPVDRGRRRGRVPAHAAAADRTPRRPAARPGSARRTTTPVVKLPAKVTAKALAASRGVPVKVKVGGPGKVSIKGTVPARRLGRRGKPVVVATGKRVARRPPAR